MSNPRPVSTAKVLAGAALGLVLLAGLFAGGAAWSTSRAWSDLARTVQRRLDEESARPLPRVLLRPADLPGNAWADYTAAMDQVKDVPNGLFEVLERGSLEDAATAGLILEKLQGALEAAARGARRTTLQVPERRSLLTQPAAFRRQDLTRVTTAVLSEARLAGLRGDGSLLAARLSDALQLASDVATLEHNLSDRVFHGVVLEAAEVVRQCWNEGRVAPGEWDRIERLWARLDEAPPDVDDALRACLAGEGARMAGRPLSEFRLDKVGFEEVRPPGLRDLYSERRQFATYYRALEDAVAGARGCAAWPAARRQAYWKAVREEKRYGDPWVMPELIVRNLLGAQAMVRVVRAALAQARRGEVLPLADPFGDRLHQVVEDGWPRVWSNGVDGRDDGGGVKDVFMRVRRQGP